MTKSEKLLDVMTVTESRKIVHRAHPTQSTKPVATHVARALDAEDSVACIGKAVLGDDGKLYIQLRAMPINGRLIISLPR